MKIEILHNPRCSKSREGLFCLQQLTSEIQINEYLKTGVSLEQLSQIIKKLSIPIIELVRTNEKLWIENFKGQTFSDSELIKILAENPKLIQRPIIIKGNKAIIGRPTEKIVSFFKE